MTKETDLPTLQETLKLAEHLVSHKIFMIEDGSGQMYVKLCPWGLVTRHFNFVTFNILYNFVGI